MTDDARRLARAWIEAWIRMDVAWLETNLAPDFVHTSPFGRLEGRRHYLDTVVPMARKSVLKLTIKRVVGGEDEAAIWFENTTPHGIVPSCDWVRTDGGRIVEIQSFYDTVRLRDVLSDDDQDSFHDME